MHSSEPPGVYIIHPSALRADCVSAYSGSANAVASVTINDFWEARKQVSASATRGAMVDPGSSSWDDIGGVAHVKLALEKVCIVRE